MATTKKAVAKKPVAKKAPAARKSTTAPAKKTSVARKPINRASSKSVEAMKSFRVYKENVPFTTFKITKQTVYWVILVAFIIFVQLWIIKLQVEVAALVDQQEASNLLGQ